MSAAAGIFAVIGRIFVILLLAVLALIAGPLPDQRRGRQPDRRCEGRGTRFLAGRCLYRFICLRPESRAGREERHPLHGIRISSGRAQKEKAGRRGRAQEAG